MAKVGNGPTCGVCKNKLVKNGKTSSGRTRWRCKTCGASSTLARPDTTAKAQFRAFHQWATGKLSVSDTGIARSTFYRNTYWCWKVHPTLIPTGEQYRYLMLDGTYFNGFCALTAYNGQHIIGWQYCDREKVASWTLLLQRLPAPDLVIFDGHGALESVIKALWPETRIQRCYFHIRQTIHKHLTRNPRTIPGQQLLSLIKALKDITTLQLANKWEEQFMAWRAMHETTLKARTYAKDHAGNRPLHVKPNQVWWYTHLRLRRADRLIHGLLKNKQLFTWLEMAAEDETLPWTTSPLEGGINAGIKDHLRAHRGLKAKHAMSLVSWHLYQRTQNPVDPWSFVTPKHWSAKPAPRPVTEEDPGPELYGRRFSYEDGNGIQKGWGGRR
ncbi:IS1249 family transposase [Glutamicibacter creatinolyticus]|uniref:IS1249 family transposase n=1 Tax=Glutamicibacter creatinolyticus TaxID=162496 RepID=UPI0037C0F881